MQRFLSFLQLCLVLLGLLPIHAASAGGQTRFPLRIASDGTYLEDAEGKPFLITGDAAWSLRAIEENVPPPRWATALLGDTRRYRATLSDLHALAARRTGVVLVPSHCRSLRP